MIAQSTFLLNIEDYVDKTRLALSAESTRLTGLVPNWTFHSVGAPHNTGLLPSKTFFLKQGQFQWASYIEIFDENNMTEALIGMALGAGTPNQTLGVHLVSLPIAKIMWPFHWLDLSDLQVSNENVKTLASVAISIFVHRPNWLPSAGVL